MYFCIDVSIHLMLLFIRKASGWECYTELFQYISCYSLSQTGFGIQQAINAFQYISCYSLSRGIYLRGTGSNVSIHLMLLFIFETLVRNVVAYGFNTSHVTLYLYFPLAYLESVCCFNTSHVTLYLSFSAKFLIFKTRFNTSHVTLYRLQCRRI